MKITKSYLNPQFKLKGFTLIETLIALAIFSVLTATLVVISKSSHDNMSRLETTAVARIALDNIVLDFQQQHKNPYVGRYQGNYQLSHFNFYWEIKVERSQQIGKNLLIGQVYLDGNRDDRLTQLTLLL